ncbi:restriction endonuclease subunit S [Paracoccus methylarcula]|uniref:Restriction endonuclease subunit S n=1 Tax=Paracoccus methylarcula TaxID=72022 RepID=A0A422QVJ3_9RHOB|nr:restriction endonuclease subunit S [Paracoccus methylarcula]RNF33970.1 restriction endonuclease subunit S [Paracoccus methylarcula]
MSFTEVPIGAAFDVFNGATPASGEPAYWDGDIPWVGPADLGKLSIRYIAGGGRSITQEGFSSCGTQMVPAGTIILSIRAPIGHMAIASQPMCFNQGCRGLVPRSMVRTDFAYWSLLSRKPQLEAAGQGTTFIELGRDKLRAERIPLPDLATQKAIADFLDREIARIDQLIEKKKRLVELLGKKQKAFATETATGANHPGRSITGLGQLPLAPSHWRVCRVATVFKESFEMGGEDLPVLSVSINWGISDRELDDEDRHRIVTYIQDRSAYKRVRVGDLVYNMMRAWQGAFGVAKVDGLVSPAYVVARPTEKIHAPYFEHLLRTPMWIEEFRRASKGIADFRQRLYWEHFRQVRIILPPFEEQVHIADQIAVNAAAVKEVLAPIATSIDRLREFRSALITAAVTGRIDVATWSKQGQTDRQLDEIEEAMQP